MLSKVSLLSLTAALVGVSAFASTANASIIDIQASLYSPLVPKGTETVINTQGVATPASGVGVVTQGSGANSYTLAFNVASNQGIVQGDASGVHAAPVAGVTNKAPTYLTGNFGSKETTDVSKSGTYLSTGLGTITLTFATPQKSLALLWGSIDSSNFLTFANGDSVTGAQVQKLASGFVGEGDRGAGGSAYVIVTEDNPFSSVTFSSKVVSFELNGVVGSTTQISTVPLPASAPLFGAALLALGGFGYGMNRWVAPKNRKQAAAA